MSVDFGTGSVDLGPPRRRAVLAILLINIGKVVSVSMMVEAIWGAHPPAHASATLQSYVSRLRKLLRRNSTPGGPELQLRYRSPGYVLLGDADQIDVGRFEQAVVHGMVVARRMAHTEAFTALGLALRSWTAPPFEDLADYEFASRETLRLEQVRLRALEGQAESAFALGRDQEMLPVLEYEVGRNPTRERLVGLLMRAQYRTGRPADALYVFHRTRRTLAEELGADISPELQRVHAEILRHDPTLQPVDDPDADAPAPELDTEPLMLQTRVELEPYQRSPMPTVTSVVGRADELRSLSAALESALAGRGRTMLIFGEAGLGKTALVQDFGNRVRATGTDIVTVQCPQTGEMSTYWVWVRLLARAVAERPQAFGSLPAAARRVLRHLRLEPETAGDAGAVPVGPVPTAFDLHDAIDQLLRQLSHRPLVLVLEDFQWSDEQSQAVLRFVARQLARSSILLVVTFRTFRIVYDSALRATLADVRQLPEVEEIHLGSLSPAATAEMITLLPGMRPGLSDPALLLAVHERAQGNPSFAIQLAEGLDEGAIPDDVATMVPAALREVVLQRIRAMPRDVSAVLEACSVLHPDSPVSVLENIVMASFQMHPDGIRTVIRCGLLMMTGTDGERIGFVHSLIRDVLLQELSVAVRAELQLRALAALIAMTTDPNTAAPAIASYAAGAMATEPSQVIEMLLQAAHRSEYRLSYSATLAWLEQAATVAGRSDVGSSYAGTELEVLRRAAKISALVHGQNAPRTLAFYDRIEHSGQIVQDSQYLTTLLGRFFGTLASGHPAPTAVMISTLSGLCRSQDRPSLEAAAHYGSGVLLHFAGRTHEAMAEFDLSVTLAEAVPDLRFHGCRPYVGVRCWQAMIHQLDGTAERAWQLIVDTLHVVYFDDESTPVDRIALLHTAALLGVLDGDAPRALSAAQEALRLAERAGLDLWRNLILLLLTWARVRTGQNRPEEVDTARAAMVEIARADHGLRLALHLGLLADIERMCGQPAQQLRHIRQMHESAAQMGDRVYPVSVIKVMAVTE